MTRDEATGGPTRRQVLRAGGLGMLGWNLASLLRAGAVRGSTVPGTPGPIRACILIFYYGGPSHIDTWDMKPKAPREVRGEFRPIATNVPGIQVCEHMPHSARVVDRLAIVRSVHHPMTNHNAAAFAALIGAESRQGGPRAARQRPERPAVPRLDAEPRAARAARAADVRGTAARHAQRRQAAGSGRRVPRLGARPVPVAFRSERAGIPTRRARTARRRAARPARPPRGACCAGRRACSPRATSTAIGRGPSSCSGRGRSVARSGSMRKIPGLRDRYGRTKLGQSLILARRLVEAGVRFVTVYDHQVNGQLANWDAHADVFPRHKNDLIPPGRPRVRGPRRRPDRPRAARLDAGDRLGRVRPDAEDQRHGRPRPLAVLLHHGARRGRRAGRDDSRRERQARRLARPRRRHAGRPRRDALLAVRPRPGVGDPRPRRPALSPGRGPAGPRALRGVRPGSTALDLLISWVPIATAGGHRRVRVGG